MKVAGVWRRAIEPAPGGERAVLVLDQARLPYETVWMRLDDVTGGYRSASRRASEDLFRDRHSHGSPPCRDAMRGLTRRRLDRS